MVGVTRRQAIATIGGAAAVVLALIIYLRDGDTSDRPPVATPTPASTPTPPLTPSPTPLPPDKLIVAAGEVHELIEGEHEQYQQTAIRRGGRLTQDRGSRLTTGHQA